MNPRLSGDQISFSERRAKSNPYRLLLWFGLILGGLWLLWQIEAGEMQSLNFTTPVPTRSAASLVEEARTLFDSGRLLSGPAEVDAIEAYQEALRLDPDNPALLTEMARAQAYSSALLSTDEARLARMAEALEAIDRAKELSPDDSMVRAVRALVLDWTATNPLTSDEDRELYLSLAMEEAVRALDLDSQNSLALTYYAEVLLDQQNWVQAQQIIEQAVAENPGSMDVHRVYANVLESLGRYRDSISEFEKAAEINPNLTFLYLRIGYTYRHLQVFDKALEYFDRAAMINEQNGVNDPGPYVGIAKTYAQQGQFFVAARNAEKALEFDPSNSDTYGQLGIIYIKSRNYEGALPVLKCAVEGCTADENEIGAVDVNGQPLSSTTLEYYLRYGSVLAALSRPGLNYCPKAMDVMDIVAGRFSDETTLSVVQENRVICSRVGEST
ncbi:MAG TPA: tetratricopeptide repeat protein [Anaerolineales bacterium]|nr:tetratricopeptide repeat protein [Anaerolineales bacterium]